MSSPTAALIALEKQTRDSIEQRIAAARDQVTAQTIVTIHEQDYTSGNEVVSDPVLHAAVVAALAGSQTDSEDTTRAAYLAAAVVALLALRSQMHDIGHNVTDTVPVLGGVLPTLLANVGAAYAHALPAVQRAIQTVYDAYPDDDRRIVKVREALNARFAALTNSVRASGVVGVYRAPTDLQQAVYRDYAAKNPTLPLKKTWEVTSRDPCPACAALDGTTIAVAAEFDHGTTADPAVYFDLFGPPRHPNCRCRLRHTL